jgi:lipoyl(octanoyl) transferase
VTRAKTGQPTVQRSAAVEPEWHVSPGLIDYDDACQLMERRVADIITKREPELIWLLQHPPLYTAGTSARSEDLFNPLRLPVFDAQRGGQYTYHGPGQRVVYVMLDVQTRFGGDVRAFIYALERWIIAALGHSDIEGRRVPGRVGIWVDDGQHGAAGDERHAKIAAIGLRLRHGISFHGLSINVAPDLTHYDGIVPCGIEGSRVTSLQELGKTSDMAALDAVLKQELPVFSKQ